MLKSCIIQIFLYNSIYHPIYQMLKYVNSFAASKNLCTFASVKGTQSLPHNIGCLTMMQQGQSHPYSDMEAYIITTCHNDGLGIVVPISDTWYNMYMLPIYAIVKNGSNIIKF